MYIRYFSRDRSWKKSGKGKRYGISRYAQPYGYPWALLLDGIETSANLITLSSVTLRLAVLL